MLRQERYSKYMYVSPNSFGRLWMGSICMVIFSDIKLRFGKLIIESKYYLVLSLRGRT